VKSLKTIAATGVIAVAATALVFGGLHLGQSSAGATARASQPTKAKATHTVTMTAKQFAQLMRGQWNNATVRGNRNYTRGGNSYSQQSGYRSGSRSYTRSGSHTRSGSSSNRCYDYGHSGSGWSNGSSGSHSGSGWGGGGCW
jgi:hypothetical protein